MADNTVFDSAFRTMIEKVPEVVIPLINEAFGRDYPLDEPFEQYRNEHETVDHRIATDSFFRVRDMCYHIECQSTPDSTMVVRMIEYDFAIALEEAIRNGAPYEMRFPQSCVLFLRDAPADNGKLKMRVLLPSGDSFMYETGVVLAQSYGKEEIFAKELLILLPFYIMRYEGEFDDIAENNERTGELLAECEMLRFQLESAAISRDNALLYEHIVELAVRVADHVLAKQQGLMRKVRASMGGEILELMSDRIAAAEEEARKRGREEGRKEGREEGREEGRKEGRKEGREEGREEGRKEGRKEGREEGREEEREKLAHKLRELGVDEALIEEALS